VLYSKSAYDREEILKMGKHGNDKIIDELKRIDTPTVGNVVATYPGNPL